MRGVMSGRHIGLFLGHPPTGRSFAAEQVHFFTLHGGKLLTHHAVRDDLMLHRQLGLFGLRSCPSALARSRIRVRNSAWAHRVLVPP
jgi:hypothetical protein